MTDDKQTDNLVKEVDYVWADVGVEIKRLTRAVTRLEEALSTRDVRAIATALPMITQAHSALLISFGKLWAISVNNLLRAE